jgi:hypothetical protein
MKVFISHSSSDSWVAEKIRDDIIAIGIEVFLDTKDVETGDAFDDVIRQRVIDADEMVMLVSPTALKSFWVMMEVGAARYLGKRLVPILINVSPNELPQPINRHLARDLNQIDRYYEELKRRSSSGETTEAPVLLPSPTPSESVKSLSVGDQVVIAERPLDPEGFPVLNEDMNPYLGMAATIEAPGWEDQGTKTFRLDVDDGIWLWAERWLSRRNAGPSGGATSRGTPGRRSRSNVVDLSNVEGTPDAPTQGLIPGAITGRASGI